MAFEVKLKLDLGGAFADLNELETAIREKAAVSAINKTLAQGNTQMVRAISAEFNVTQEYVRKRLDISRAKFVGGKAVISGALLATNDGKRRSANLIAFVEKSVSLAQAKKRAKAGNLNQLRFKIKRKGQPVIIPGAFIGNQGRTVFIREGKSRLPIKALQTIDVPQMFNTRRINKIAVKYMEEAFPDIFEHEVQFFTQRFNARRAR